MKRLIIKTSLNNQTFMVCTDYLSSHCFYSIKDKYITSLTFASNTYAQVQYKNVVFSGKVTKQTNWSVRLDHFHVIRKHRSLYFFGPREPIQYQAPNDESKTYATVFSENIQALYSLLVNAFPEQHALIENEEEFKQQVCEKLTRRYADADAENLDVIIEYEDDEIGPDGNPIIVKGTYKTFLLLVFEDYLVRFHNSETDRKNIALENLIKEVPELEEIPHNTLQKELELYLAEKRSNPIKHSIEYCRSSELFDIGTELYDICKHNAFLDSAEEKIDRTLSILGIEDIDKTDVYDFIKTRYSEEYIPDAEEFKKDVIKFIDQYAPFNRLYSQFVSLFGTDYITVEWNDETIRLFQAYDRNELSVDPKRFADYEAYKYVLPFYKKCFFRKDGIQPRLTTKHLPDFTAFASSVLDVLFKHNILTDGEDRVIYNKDVPIDPAFEELKTLPHVQISPDDDQPKHQRK